MKKQILGSLCAVAVLFSLVLVGGSPFAQERADAPKADAPKDEAPARTRAQQRGRLPNFYRAVVTPDQRSSIYAVPTKYEKQIEELELQIDALEAKRDAEIEAVLTPEQREKVKSLEAEAKKRREASRSEAADGAAPAEK
jgi:hypothetical protein